MNIHFHHHFSRHLFFSVSVHAPTYGLFVRIYLFIFPCCRLMVCPPFTHFAQSVHFIAPSYRLTRSPLRFILVYTPSFVMNTRTHIVCINSFHVSSNFLHTMLLSPLTSLPVVGYNFCTGPVFYRYLRNLLDACWMRNHEYAVSAE